MLVESEGTYEDGRNIQKRYQLRCSLDEKVRLVENAFPASGEALRQNRRRNYNCHRGQCYDRPAGGMKELRVHCTFAPLIVKTSSASPRLYDDSYIIRLGGRYMANEKLAFMAGIYYDKNPVANEYLNPTLPEANRIGLSFGIEAQIFENLSIQGSYLFIRGQQLTIDNSQEVYTVGNSGFNGTYNTSANIFGLSFNLGL